MKKSIVLGAASLVFLAGQAMAQTGAIDGRFTDSGERALYGAAKWVSTSTTNWGDAGPSNPCDPSGTGGDPAAVSTGVEFKIPLSLIGNPGGNVRLLAFINGSGHDYASNQFLPSLPNGTGNLGGDGSGNYNGTVGGLNLGNFAGDQYLTVNLASLSGGIPTIDGTLDAAYGPAKALQACRTGFGNATSGTQFANGSELDGMYVCRDSTFLYVFLSGNMETNFNKLELLIDTDEATNGTNPISSGNTPDVDFGALGKLNGMTFDAGFAPDYYFTFGAGGGGPDYYPNFAVIGVEGGYMGTNIAGNGSGILAGGDARGCEIALNNANSGGVAGGCPPPAGNADNANGSEINAVYSYVNNGRLHVLVTGNLESGGGTPCDAGGNKLNLFIDADGQGGQNVLLNNNVDISYGNLNRMAGLTFESDFAADYWMSIKTGGNTPYMVMDCSVLRTGGKRTNALGSPLDYGAYDGGNKADYNPVTFRGNFVPCNGNPNDPMIQDGFTANLYTNYGPRAAAESLAADNANPVGTPGLISFSINNSNFGGVGPRGSGSVADAANVSTGIEFSIDLTELGWDGSSCIKLAGFVANGDATYASNQVIGGLPGGTDTNDLAGASSVNFGNIEGTQYVVVAGSCGGGGGCPPCAADFNDDGGVDGGDIEAFFAAWEGGDSCGDVNADGGVDGGDIESFFSVWEAGGC